MSDQSETESRERPADLPSEVVKPRRPVGRPTVYKDTFPDLLVEYFSQPPTKEVKVYDAKGNERTEVLPNDFPTLARFAVSIGVTKDTLHDWATAKNPDGELKHPEFSSAYKKAKNLQEANLVEGTLKNAYNSTFAIFTAKNVLGWRDKVEQEITGANGSPLVMPSIQVSFVNPNDER
jgi:hypothetical protein